MAKKRLLGLMAVPVLALVAACTAPPPTAPPLGGSQLDLAVDCDAGDSLADALSSSFWHVGRVSITISGVCEETVAIDRDDVSLAGVNRADGINGGVFLNAANRVRLGNMTIDDGGIQSNSSTLEATGITIQNAKGSAINAEFGSTTFVLDSLISDSDGFGIESRSESNVTFLNSTVTGSAEIGLFAGVVGSATIVVEGSQIVNNVSGIAANPGGNLRIDGTLIEGNDTGVSVSGGEVVAGGSTRIIGNGVGVQLRTGSVGDLGFEGLVVEDNLSDGISISGGSHASLLDGTVRNNGADGIVVQDLSTVSVFPPAQVVNNGGWGINCEGPPAVAVLGVQGLFNPAELDLTGNTLGATSCQP
jgi:hypothetical protein